MPGTRTETVRCVCGRLLFCVRDVKEDAGEIEIKCGKCGRLVTLRLGRTVTLMKSEPAATR